MGKRMTEVGIGLIGSGFMGKCHALAYRNVKAVFGDVPTPRLEVLCDTPADRAAGMAARFGFARHTADWRALVTDPAVEIVSITTPNSLHREMAVAALGAGKHVYCEKPLAVTFAQAEEMAAAADKAGVLTIVGYNYIKNPAFLHARKLIGNGAIGRPIHFRGVVDEDYQADPEAPWSWRCLTADAGLGALGDLGCHLVSCAVGLMGPVESLIADMRTVHETRPRSDGGGWGPVENEDVASALVRFQGGAHGSIATSRIAWGRKNYLAWEVHGERGMICFDQERMNELKLFQAVGAAAEQGFKTILTGPPHPPYENFVPAQGHGLGFNDLKIIEVEGLLSALAHGGVPSPSFAEALAHEKVIHAIAESARTGMRIEP